MNAIGLSLWMWLLIACGRSSSTPPPTPAKPQLLPWVEQLTANANKDATLPLVVTMHGRGSDPERFQKFFADLDVPMRIAHLEAPVLEHDGRAWFTFRGRTRQDLRNEVDRLADLAVKTTERIEQTRPTEGKPILVGFSQGAMVVYACVLRHPGVYRKALPVSGVLFTEPPTDHNAGDMPPVVAMHGERDPVIGPAASVDAVRALQQLGTQAELRLFPDAVHWIDGELQKALFEELKMR
ncbi:MAG: prolyl oligopeptidase family serine peptidase [Myxococcota bacterium]